MKLSLCITTYNRPELTVQSFKQVYSDPRIDEIVIVDDTSHDYNYIKLFDSVESLSKVHLYRNDFNLGMHLNKRRAIELAKNDWCILFDSDNSLGISYLDAFEKEALGFGDITKVIFCPSFAKPKFNYTNYQGITLNRSGIKPFLEEHEFKCLLNTCNYICHRKVYLETFNQNNFIGAADSIWHLYNHFNKGGAIFVAPEMEYEHRVHDESGWRKDRQYNIERFNEVIELIKGL